MWSSCGSAHAFPGGDRRGVTPVPIPNTEVKPFTADGTARVTVWESRSLPGFSSQPDAVWRRAVCSSAVTCSPRDRSRRGRVDSPQPTRRRGALADHVAVAGGRSATWKAEPPVGILSQPDAVWRRAVLHFASHLLSDAPACEGRHVPDRRPLGARRFGRAGADRRNWGWQPGVRRREESDSRVDTVISAVSSSALRRPLVVCDQRSRVCRS